MEEKKNNNYKAFIVPIVAVAIFALMIFGAGYAYFAATINNGAVANISANLPKQGTTLISSATDCLMDITAGSMVQSAVNTTNEKANATCTLTVTLTAEQGVSCNYSVTLTSVPVTGQDPTTYSATSGLGSGNKEFTGMLTQKPSGVTPTYGGTETQMDTLDGKKLVTTSITVSSGTSTTHSYTFQEKWYNANVNQGVHADKKYRYKLHMTDAQC